MIMGIRVRFSVGGSARRILPSVQLLRRDCVVVAAWVSSRPRWILSEVR